MTILTYLVVSLIILAFCALGLSIGLLLKRRGLTTCGRGASELDQHDITCPACENRGQCKNR